MPIPKNRIIRHTGQMSDIPKIAKLKINIFLLLKIQMTAKISKFKLKNNNFNI